jgi:hypothetical protein
VRLDQFSRTLRSWPGHAPIGDSVQPCILYETFNNRYHNDVERRLATEAVRCP